MTGHYGAVIVGVRVSDDSFIMLTADVPGDEPVNATIAVGPERHMRVQGEHGPRGIARGRGRTPGRWSRS